MNVNLVVPVVSISGAASVDLGDPYTVDLSATGPGAINVAAWILHWGDGAQDTLPGDAQFAGHTYRTNDFFTVAAVAILMDGSAVPAGTLIVRAGNIPPTIVAVTTTAGETGLR